MAILFVETEEPGADVYVRYIGPNRTCWNGTALVAFAVEDWPDYAFPAEEQGGVGASGIYEVEPSADLPDGTEFIVTFYRQNGDDPAITDGKLSTATYSTPAASGGGDGVSSPSPGAV